MSTQRDVIVVGGGIGGLSAALALSLQGLSVLVLERSGAFGDVGAGLQLAPNCTRILDHYGLLDEARALGVLPTAMIARDAIDGSELTRLDLRDLARRYGYPYLVIHRSDLHAIFLRACQRAGVQLRTSSHVVDYENTSDGALVRLADGGVETGSLVIAADGLHSVARAKFVGDETVSSSYVAYRGTVPAAELGDRLGEGDVNLSEVVVYLGPRCHFVHYGLRGGDVLNQVAVFKSAKAGRGENEWGTPDELDKAFLGMHEHIRDGLPHMWRDKWWQMLDRDPIDRWVFGRVVLVGDAAHPPLQYMAQGAIMAIEDGWVLGQQVRAQQARAGKDVNISWKPLTAAYEAVRAEHCRRVVITARAWGDLWHVEGEKRLHRNAILRAREIDDYSFTDWIYGPTALVPEDEPQMYQNLPLSRVELFEA